MEEIQPFSEKPIDRSIALAIYNGTFVWHTAAKKAKANKMSLYEFRNFSILLLLFHLLSLLSIQLGSYLLLLSPPRS
jgi:ATP-binding cassette subfamily C (CFTR/MRP) protein 5